MKANNVYEPGKTAKSFNRKANHSLSDFNNKNFRETLSIFSFNSNAEKKNKMINIRLSNKDEYEFTNLRTMKKEISQKIYTKESGEMINIIKKSNEDLKISNKNLSESTFKSNNNDNFNQNSSNINLCNYYYI